MSESERLEKLRIVAVNRYIEVAVALGFDEGFLFACVPGEAHKKIVMQAKMYRERAIQNREINVDV